MDAKKAYDHWKKSHKINLRVYTDEEMFELGFNQSQTILKAMEVIIAEQDKEIKQLKKRKEK